MLNIIKYNFLFKILIFWFLGSLFINTGIYILSIFFSLINKEFRNDTWAENLVFCTIIVACTLLIGFLIKKIRPPKRKGLYFLRWAVLFILFPFLAYSQYMIVSEQAFTHILGIIIWYFLAGFLIGYFDYKIGKRQITK